MIDSRGKSLRCLKSFQFLEVIAYAKNHAKTPVMFWHTFRAIVWDILSQMKSPTRQINASTKNFPFTHFFAASVLHRDPAYSILELFSVLNPIWSLVYPMSLKDRSIFYLDKKCCSLICSRILEHEL